MPTKGFSDLKQKKWKLPLDSPYSNSLDTKCQLKLAGLIFWTNIAQIRYFQSKRKKSEQHNGILHIWISLTTKFQLKLRIRVFGPNLAKKGTTEQNNQFNKLQAFTFCVVNFNSMTVFKYFEDYILSLFWTFEKRKSLASWPRFTFTLLRMGVFPM